jgi:hypothetical protein
MQVMPLIGFYFRRSQEIEKLLDSGASSDGHLVLDVLHAVVPLLKKYYPALNKAGLLDDVVTTLTEVLATSPAVPPAVPMADLH